MNKVTFSKIIPGGNPTIIVTAPAIADHDLPAVAAELMSPFHLQAEQVGFLRLPGGQASAALPEGNSPICRPFLQMMGGEFCVNATRSAAAYLADAGLLDPLEVGEGNCLQGCIGVSGADVPVDVIAADTRERLFAGVKESLRRNSQNSASVEGTVPPLIPVKGLAIKDCCYTAALVGLTVPPKPELLSEGDKTLVRLPGITHLLVPLAEGESLPECWPDLASQYRHEAGIEDEEASGVIWYAKEAEGYAIFPAVYVKATNSEFLETACGSGSVAVALMHRHTCEKSVPDEPLLAVKQPSGEFLHVLCTFPEADMPSANEKQNRDEQSAGVWVCGKTVIVASGTALVSSVAMPDK